MNAFDEARREILAALLIEYHRTPSALSDFDDLKARYGLKSRKDWFDPIVSELESSLIMTRSMADVAARVHARGYGRILREVMDQLGANVLEIDARKEEITSDAAAQNWFRVPDGWKWFELASQESSNGSPSGIILSDELEAELVPASDRMVSLDHNSAPYREISEGLASLHEELRSSNQLDCDPDERDRLLASLKAARDLWDATQLKVIQIKVGVILAIEDASKMLLKVGKSVGAALLVDAIKAFVKSKTGIEL